MKIKSTKNIICLLIFSIFVTQVWSASLFDSDSNYDVFLAVSINENDNIIGKLEYSNDALQLVTFNLVGGEILTEPYLFEILEKTIVSKNVYRIKCHSINDKYGSPEIIGTIDFSNELKPKIHLVNTYGNTYVSNISEKGKEMHMKYIPNVWLGQ